VEGGPPPVRLSDGNYLFIYNSARKDSHSGNGLEYNPGWIIINGTNPTQILERSSEPLLSPREPWEVGLPPYLDLTPNVIFIEGMRAAAIRDQFVVYYGAADSVIGVAQVTVQI